MLIIGVAVAVVAAACGGGNDDTADDSSTEGATTIAPDTGDAEDGLVESSPALDSSDGDDDGAAASEDSEAAAMVDQAVPTTTIPADASRSAGESADGGGLFGDPAAPEIDSDTTEDNTFRDYGVRPFVSTDQDPLSTFALDVDTASYSIAKRWVSDGARPPADSVRVEEYVNSFDYDYPAPGEGLTVVADGGPSPYDPDNVIVRLGVQAERVAADERPPASLTFVVDTSGSMDRQDRLELVKTSLQRLVIELDRDDTVALVTYSDNAEVLLPPTSVADADIILDAIAGLTTDGSTNLEAGLNRGYDLANESFRPGGINRVVLASDGVANVGLTDPQGLVAQIRGDADRGIQLVTVGVGMGNFNDVTMEQLANDGDGFYAYVDDVAEAERLFSDDLVSTLLTVAIDGKIQVSFDGDAVSQYRLIGFENRAVLDDDFRNDAVDAGELGAGHQVTALYELTLEPGIAAGDRLGTVQLRWQDPEEGSVVETRLELTGAIVNESWSATDDDFKLAVTVAAFAELLRESPHTGDVGLQQVAEEAESLSSGPGPVAELAELIRRVDQLT